MKEYKVVFNLEGQPFDEMVSQCLNDGWELYGTPWTHQEPEGGLVHLYQAIKRDITYVLVEEEAQAETETAETPETDSKSDDSKD